MQSPCPKSRFRTHKQTKWSWQQEHEEAFQWAKNALQRDSLLVHYDSSKPLVLACDASQYGSGAVPWMMVWKGLLHMFPEL